MAKILVVDDEASVAASVAVALKQEGHELLRATSGEDAVARARSESVDLVLTDIRLSGMSGMEVLEEIKRSNPEIQVVVMTAFATIESAVQAMRLGAQNYLRKPFATSDLIRVVDEALTHRELVAEVSLLKRGGRDQAAFAGIIGVSRELHDVLELVSKVAETESTVLISGETGTGKELVGRAIHRVSRRRDRIFCAVNSAAFPETLLESELFGHRRGAFTGASMNKKGLFEHAHLGTVFLDEVAEMPLSMQAKLLRFLQTGEIRPVGEESTRIVDVRLITATNKDLEREVAEGRFREDLYYRLAVIPIHIPPLRERTDDIDVLTTYFLKRFATKFGKRIERLDAKARQFLSVYPWPGNVRELENTIERGVALCRSPLLTVEDLPTRLVEKKTPNGTELPQSLQALERAHILRTLDRVNWNRKRAAEILEISTTTLWRRLKEFGIESDTVRQSAGPA